VYNYQNGLYKRGPAASDPALQARFKSEADFYIHTFYRQALDKAPDNPHYGSYALMLNDPDWQPIFWKAMERAPAHHHAGYMAFNLFHQRASREKIVEAIQVYESATSNLLHASAADRPGFVRTPAITGAEVKAEDSGEVVRLAPGQRMTLPVIALRGAPQLRVGVFIEVLDGAVELGGAIEGVHPGASAVCEPNTLSPQTLEHYWSVTCNHLDGAESVRVSVTAINAAAVVRIRDYYPMFSIVRRPS
jgi:hypothetical protein